MPVWNFLAQCNRDGKMEVGFCTNGEPKGNYIAIRISGDKELTTSMPDAPMSEADYRRWLDSVKDEGFTVQEEPVTF